MSIASPCVRNCCLNENDICLGCCRSLEEIKQWGAATDDRKLDILENASFRREKNIKVRDFILR